MLNHESKEEVTTLAIRSAQEFSKRASLVSRGLREITGAPRVESADALLNQATELVRQGRFNEASDVCTSALEKYPQDEGLLVTRAVCLAKEGGYEEGLPFLKRALQINTANQYSWILAARFYNHLGNSEEELCCWNQVVAIDPDLKGAWRGRGDCLLKLQRYREAMEAFDSELNLNPSDAYCQSQREIAIAALSGGGEWTPTSILNLLGWYSEKFDGRQLAPYTETRLLNLMCQIRNISDRECLIGKQLSVYRRSKETGKMQRFAEALILEDATFKLPLRIDPDSEVDPISVEVTWTCPLDRTDPDCVEELFDVTWDTAARDDEFGTVIKFVE